MEKVSKYGDGSNNKELIITDKFGNVKSIFQKKISLTTLGTSGPSTFINNVLNVPDYSGALSGYVPTSRTLTINGTTYDLSANRTWNVGTVTSIGTTGPITGGTITGSGTIGITQATTSTDGYLSSTDWNTFNNKQNAITLTTVGSSGPATLIGSTLNIPNYSTALTGYVPYVGATQNVDLGEYQLKAGQIEFDQTPTGTPGVAIMQWNDQDGTVDLGLKGGNVTLQIGQEQVTRVVNKTGGNLLEANYQSVRISGAQGNRLKVALAQANNDANSAETLGIVTETINDNQEGFITTSGLVRNINTTGSIQGETWADGDMLYLSGTVAGQLTNIKPTAPIHTVIMGYVVRAHATQGQIYVKVDNGYELDELHNVAISSPLNNQGLFYETATQLWKNKSIDTALGYTPVPTTRQLTINGTTYDLSANRIWSVGTVTSVTASAPLSSSGGTTPNITISQATGSTNGYLSAADWTTFNSKQPAGNYITALSGEASASGPGTASVTLNNASVTAKVLTGVNITGGSINASDSILTAFGKLQNQINGLIGSSVYQGTWNASTNTPALASGVGTRGYYYIVSVAGSTNLDGITDWNVGDWAIFDGTAWQQVDNTDSVTSVNGQTGAVSLTTDNIPEGATNLYFTNLRARQSLSLTTTGTSGAATYDSITGVLNIPQYQSVLTNPVTGTGTANYVARWTSSSQIGTGVLYDDGSYVGIGTSAPDYKLDIRSNTAQILSSDSSFTAWYIGNSGVGNAQTYYDAINGDFSGLDYGFVGQNNVGYMEYYVGPFSPAPYHVFSSGNVGIGTTAPIHKLSVVGKIGGSVFGDSYIEFPNTGNTILKANDNVIVGYLQDTVFTQGGNVGIGSLGPNSLLSATERVLLIENSNLASLYLSSLAGRKWSMSSAGDGALVWWDLNSVAERMRINSSGNVGINTSSPSQKLDVAGRARVDRFQYQQGIDISNLNLNDYTDAGFYIGSGIANAPDPVGWYYVTVERHSDANWVHQTATSYGAGNTGNRIYSRVKEAGAWGAWKELADNASISGTTNYVSKFTSSTTIGNSLIYDNGTNVGIGTTSPGVKFTVAGTTMVTDGTNSLLFGQWDGASNRIEFVNRPLRFAGYYGNSDIIFANNSDQERMRITTLGNIGIGTSSPTEYGGYKTLTLDSASGTFTEYRQNGTPIFRMGADGNRPFLYGMTNAPMDFFTNGSLALTITSGGYVGIGTSNPSGKLNISGVTSYNTGLNIDGSSINGVGLSLRNASGNDWYIISTGGNNGGGASNLGFYNDTVGDYRVYFKNNGNVGIGTTSPNKQLTFAQASDDAIQIRRLTTSQGNPSIGTGISWTWSDSSTDNETWAAIRVIMPGSGNSNMTFSTTPVGGGGSGLSERMRITDSGLIGIGTTAPSQKLHVDGNARVTGAYYDSNNQAGTSGQILSSTGSGTDWVDSPTSTATSVAQLIPNATVTYNWTGQVIDSTWVNIFSRADNVLTTGTWMVRLYVNDSGQGGQHYDYAYSGTMTWYQYGTNQSGIPAASEIALHRMGHAANSCVIYLRTTEEPASDGGNGKLQIKGNYTNTSNTTITFTFVKII